MDLLQLEEAEYNLIRFPQRGVCLFKCGNERYLLEVHAPAYKEALFGTAGRAVRLTPAGRPTATAIPT